MEASFLHFSLDSESKGLVDFYPGLVQPRSQVQSSWKLVSLAYYCPWAQPLPRVPGHPSLLTDELDPSLGMDLCKSISARKIVQHQFSAECDLPIQRTCKPGVPSSSTDTHVRFQGEGRGANSMNTEGKIRGRECAGEEAASYIPMILCQGKQTM